MVVIKQKVDEVVTGVCGAARTKVLVVRQNDATQAVVAQVMGLGALRG